MNKKIQGFVVKTSVYKETNLIVSLLTSEGICTFKAVSALKVPYKLSNLIQLYVFGEYELISSNDDCRNVLIGGKVLKEYKNIINDYEASVFLSFISESLFKDELLEKNGYRLFDYCIDNITKKELFPNVILLVLKTILKTNGSLLETECCANCGSKNDIVTVSIHNGGFICHKCNQSLNLSFGDIDYLKGYRYIVKSKLSDIDKFVLSKQIYSKLFHEFIEFLDSNCGIKFSSKKLVETIFFM